MITRNILGLLLLCMSMGHGYFILRNERQLYGDSESQSYPAVFPSYANSFYPSQLRPTSRRQVERSVEFIRGKRFWLFAKKDGADADAEFVPPSVKQQNLLTQGLWRSGIVGRRRRR